MFSLRSRHLLAGFAAAAAASLLGPGVAAASTPALPVVTLVHPAPLALASTGEFQPYVTWTTKSKVNADVTLTIDARGLAKVANVRFDGDCTMSGLVATCQDHLDNRDGYGPDGMTRLILSAKKGAPLGARGSYRISGTSAKLHLVGGSSTVEIGGPQFAAKPLVDHKNLRVGSTVSETVQFTNTGNRPAKGAAVYLETAPGLTFATHYSNCKYGSFDGGALAVCYPSGAIRLGETAALAAPVKLHVNSRALYSYLDTAIMPAGYSFAMRTGVHWTWGKGSRLGLKVVRAGHSSTAPYGTVPLFGTGNNQPWGTASLYAHNTADFAVTGSTARAARGHTATFHFSLRNNGPATLYDRSGGELEPVARVIAPAGTTIVGHSRACWAETPSNPGHSAYLCRSAITFAKGQVFQYSLTVRVDKVITHARGSVHIVWGPILTWRPAFDPKKSNDTAVLVLN